MRTLLILLRPKADAKDIDGKLAYFAGKSGVEFKYEVVRMWQQPVGPFLHGGLQLLPLATLCKLPADRPIAEALHDVVMEIDSRLSQECEPAHAVQAIRDPDRLERLAFAVVKATSWQEILGTL